MAVAVQAYNWQYGVGVPKGEVARSAAEAEKIAKEIGMRHNKREKVSNTH